MTLGMPHGDIDYREFCALYFCRDYIEHRRVGMLRNAISQAFSR